MTKREITKKMVLDLASKTEGLEKIMSEKGAPSKHIITLMLFQGMGRTSAKKENPNQKDLEASYAMMYEMAREYDKMNHIKGKYDVS